MAEVLLGLVDPSGKLPLTFPRAAAQLPAFGAFPERVTEYREGVFVGYRHFDANALEPLFPFGHGLSYTRFEYSELAVERATAAGRRSRSTSASWCATRAIAPEPRWRRSTCTTSRRAWRGRRASSRGSPGWSSKPGESREVKLMLGYRDLAFFDEATHAWTVEPGAFEVQVGASSRDLRLRQQFTYAAQ